MISIMAALTSNYVIGKDGKLPWHLPEDLKLFQKYTKDHTVIMGRKTYESILDRIQKPLPHRRNIVISTTLQDSKVEIVHSVEEALQKAQHDTESFIIGGEKVYARALQYADRLYLSHIRTCYAGDTFFPRYDAREWLPIHEEDKTIFTFVIYDRMNWTLWRQDDNGHKFLIQTGLTQNNAKQLVEQYEQKGHKQMYWAKKKE